MNKLSGYIIISTFILASCGGGGVGGSAPDNIISPTISISGPSTISWSDSGPVGCTGSSIDDCIKLTANVTDPQNRISTAQWQNLNTLGGVCYPVTTNANVMSVPLYCTSDGYSCTYSYDVSWYTGTKYEYIQPFFTVNVQGPIPCASGSAVDGYIQEANIFVDLNRNFVQDINEPFTTTGQLGQFTFDTPISDNSLLVLKGGIDSATGIVMPENYTLIGISRNNEKFIISPISSIAYFMGENFSPNDSLGIKLFDVYQDDPMTQLNSEEASSVLLTNIKISIIAETISQTLKQDDYLKIYESIAKIMTDKELTLRDISSKELIFETITEIDYQDMLDMTDAIYVSERVNSFLDSIVIDESNEYLQKFEIGLKTLPKEIKKSLESNNKIL